MGAWGLTERIATSIGEAAAGRAGEGPDLVLAHGWPWSSYSWARVVPALAQRYRVHWFDMPGYGASEMASDKPTDLAAQGRALLEVLAHWGLSAPRVIAHDMGGAVALRAHLLHGQAFERLVLMNVVALRPWGSAFFDHVGRHIEAFRGLPPHIHAALAGAYIDGALARPIPAEDRAALIAPWLTEAGADSFYRQFAAADEALTAAFEPLLPQMRCPVVVLWGEDDPWIPLARGQALHGRMPGSQFEALPGLGHLPQLEAPDLVAARLIAALTAP